MTRVQEYNIIYQTHFEELDDSEKQVAQTFTTGTTGQNGKYKVDELKLRAVKVGSPGNVNWTIEGVDENNNPNGIIFSSGTILEASIPTSAAVISIIPDEGGKQLAPSTTYILVLKATSSNSSNKVKFSYDAIQTYTGGQVKNSNNNGITWSDVSRDLYFQILGTAFNATIVTESQIDFYAGENVRSAGATTLNKETQAKFAEAFLVDFVKYNIVDKWENLNETKRLMFSEWAARFAANGLIFYNAVDYTSRVEAEDMVNINLLRMKQIEEMFNQSSIKDWVKKE